MLISCVKLPPLLRGGFEEGLLMGLGGCIIICVVISYIYVTNISTQKEKKSQSARFSSQVQKQDRQKGAKKKTPKRQKET